MMIARYKQATPNGVKRLPKINFWLQRSYLFIEKTKKFKAPLGASSLPAFLGQKYIHYFNAPGLDTRRSEFDIYST